ncbi:hypothetical protein Bbelb_294960 [Branchiostoma belcheri]|nr:hypothetical protein Bbelb_294960 [Branchiostoma belcheri]
MAGALPRLCEEATRSLFDACYLLKQSFIYVPPVTIWTSDNDLREVETDGFVTRDDRAHLFPPPRRGRPARTTAGLRSSTTPHPWSVLTGGRRNLHTGTSHGYLHFHRLVCQRDKSEYSRMYTPPQPLRTTFRDPTHRKCPQSAICRTEQWKDRREAFSGRKRVSVEQLWISHEQVVVTASNGDAKVSPLYQTFTLAGKRIHDKDIVSQRRVGNFAWLTVTDAGF